MRWPGFCAVTALLAAMVHGLSKQRCGRKPGAWLAIVALGIGPVGAAFYAWDVGMKRGDIRVLGAASYATPLLSTGFLILAASPASHDRPRRVLIAAAD